MKQEHPMKKLLILVTLFWVPWMATGCTDILAFDITTNIDEIAIPGNLQLHQNHVALSTSGLPNTSFKIKLDGVQGQLNLLEMHFFVTDGGISDPNDTDTLDFLDYLQVNIVPNSGSTLPAVVLGTWTGPAPAGATSIELTITESTNLSDYIAEGARFELELGGIVPADETSVAGEMTFLVNPI
jgi:hypothetical protein